MRVSGLNYMLRFLAGLDPWIPRASLAATLGFRV